MGALAQERDAGMAFAGMACRSEAPEKSRSTGTNQKESYETEEQGKNVILRQQRIRLVGGGEKRTEAGKADTTLSYIHNHGYFTPMIIEVTRTGN